MKESKSSCPYSGTRFKAYRQMMQDSMNKLAVVKGENLDVLEVMKRDMNALAGDVITFKE